MATAEESTSSGASLEFTRDNQHTLKTADGRYWIVRGGMGNGKYSFLAYYRNTIIGSGGRAKPLLELCEQHNKELRG